MISTKKDPEENHGEPSDLSRSKKNCSGRKKNVLTGSAIREPIITNNLEFGCVKAPGFDDRK